MRRSALAFAAMLPVLMILVPAIGGCARSGTRGAADEEILIQRRLEYAAAAEEALEQSVLSVIRRLKAELDAFDQGHTREPPVLDVLVLSGGGELGAFGAGLLQGWGTVTDPAWKRPQFDIVSGVSTGALIAPFAFLGDDASYDRVATLYRNPKPDWIRRRGVLFFMPNNESLLQIDGLKRDIKSAFDPSFVKRVAAAAEEGRLLAIGTTNLDFGRQRMWDLGRECRNLADSGTNDRMVDIVLASSAVPGAFPPVKIDDVLYADGAISANILYEDSLRSERSLTGRWAREYPGVPMPRTRYWVVINNQLESRPQITQDTWLSVTGAAFTTSVRSATFMALQNLAGQLELINVLGKGTKEMRVISIPNSWRQPQRGLFAPETMQSLVDLGFQVGADPSNWVTAVEAPVIPARADRP